MQYRNHWLTNFQEDFLDCNPREWYILGTKGQGGNRNDFSR